MTKFQILILNHDVARKVDEDMKAFKNRGNWAALDCSYKNGLRLDYGSILSNGTREQKIGTREYFIDKNGVIDYQDIVHV